MQEKRQEVVLTRGYCADHLKGNATCGVPYEKTLLLTAAMIAFTHTCALADEGKKPSAEEAKSIQSALSQLGCAGGEYVKEPSGLFEIDDAKCKIGQYDFKLDKDFNVTLMSRD